MSGAVARKGFHSQIADCAVARNAHYYSTVRTVLFKLPSAANPRLKPASPFRDPYNLFLVSDDFHTTRQSFVRFPKLLQARASLDHDFAGLFILSVVEVVSETFGVRTEGVVVSLQGCSPACWRTSARVSTHDCL